MLTRFSRKETKMISVKKTTFSISTSLFKFVVIKVVVFTRKVKDYLIGHFDC